MRRISMMVVLALMLSVGSAWAQEEAGQFRTALSVVGGLSVGSSRSLGLPGGRGGFGGRGSDSGFAAGGGIAHDFSPRLTLEATGLYLERGASAWSADAGFRLNLEPSSRSLVPYFAASGGLYSERSGSLAVRSQHDIRDQGGRNRGDRAAETGGSRRTDGMLTLGGGVLFAAGPHVFVRPDARAQMVFSGDTRVMGLFTLNFGYRF
jgi:hypothetical protein